MSRFPVYCQWFLLCDNEATTTRPHSTLGNVPICDRCNEKMQWIEDQGKKKA